MLEVVAEETAAATPYVDLLTAHPVDGQKAQPQQAGTPSLGTAKQQVSSHLCNKSQYDPCQCVSTPKLDTAKHQVLPVQ